ncbi:hypothetical protein TYRP_005031 [Tyrophagus putrescentiae]|nr:hypothetical protein TYRP_005031 [Tyrophagus putrescentiae]
MLATNLPARHLSYDFSQQSPAMLANSHVYLPNTSHLELLGARSNSCNQLSSVAEALGDYHNHLLMRPGGFSGLMNSEVGGYSGSPRVKSNELRGKHHDEAAEEEHIYASLPEEEEEEEEEEAEQNGAQSSRGSQQLCSSGSFSARSTLPDNCQLSSFREGGDLQCGPAIVPQMSTFFNSKNSSSEPQHQQRPSQSAGSTGSSPQSSGSSGGDEECREDSGEDIYEEVAQLLPWSTAGAGAASVANTLSMAAMYYNRFILNEASGGNSSGKGGKGKSKGGSGSGHRQRPKVNRRQSFSTAYELRQRILTSQMSSGKGDHINNHGGEMELIEEDEEGEDHNYQAHHNVDQFEDSGLLSYRLSRRISTSEDNLLSIISTMANCGDGEVAGGSGGSGNSSDHTTVNSSSSSSKSGSASSTPSKSSSTSSSAVTFVKREQQQQQQPSSRSGGGLYNKKQPRNQPNRAVPSSSSFSNSANPSSAIPRAANHANSATTTTTHATNISIKELKSKKKKLAQAQQAANSRSAANTAAAGAKADNFQLRPKSALNGNNGSGGDRIVELGSLWNRSTGATAATPTKTALPNGSSTAKTPPQPRFAATGKLLAAINNSTTTTVTSGTSSSPSTPCRVPTFIPAPATRGSPAAAARGKLEQNGHNGLFASKLTPPSTYIGAGGNRAVKQNQARQNAILAKNALSGGGNGGEHERL